VRDRERERDLDLDFARPLGDADLRKSIANLQALKQQTPKHIAKLESRNFGIDFKANRIAMHLTCLRAGEALLLSSSSFIGLRPGDCPGESDIA
jgi:hypothetical protein